MTRRIVYLADSDNGCDDRTLSHTGSLTDILSETINYSNRDIADIVAIGDRWIELVRVPVDGNNVGWTHTRASNWIVDAIEVYKPVNANSKYSEVVYCYCKYAPIPSSELVAIIDGDKADRLALV